MLAQENKPRSPLRTEGAYTLTLNDTPPPKIASNAIPVAANTTQAEQSLLRRSPQAPPIVDRELPAVPTRTTKPPILPRLNLHNLSIPTSPLSALPTPPTPMSARKHLFASPHSTESPQRTQSASIRNLDQRSVVRQRLAQLENASPNPRPSTPLSPIPRRVVKSELLTTQMQLGRQGSTGSNFATSILNAYLGPDSAASESPTSASTRSSGFRAIAARIGSPPPRPRVRVDDAGRAQSGAPFSPASQYSVDDRKQDNLQAKPESGRAATPVHEFLAVPRRPRARITSPVEESAAQPAKLESASAPVLDDIRRGVEVLQTRSATDRTNIVSIRTTMDGVLEELRRLPKAQLEGTPKDTMAVTAKLEEVQIELKDHLTALHKLIDGLRGAQKSGDGPNNGDGPSAFDGVQEKLDKLLQLQQARSSENQSSDTFDAPTAAQLAETVALLSEVREQRTAHMEQQTDTVRYLNELNSVRVPT